VAWAHRWHRQHRPITATGNSRNNVTITIGTKNIGNETNISVMNGSIRSSSGWNDTGMNNRDRIGIGANEPNGNATSVKNGSAVN